MQLIESLQFVCFAPIDLKLADVILRDGWTATGVTNTAEEPAAETVIALTGCAEQVPVGCTVHFANDSTDTEYTVESRVLTSGVDAVYQIEIGTNTGGTFTLTYAGQTTNAIAFDAATSLIQLELEALDGIGNGDVAVAVGDADYEYKITFQDDLADMPITGFTFDGTSLTGGTGQSMVNTAVGAYGTGTSSITLTAGLAEVVEAGGAVTFTGRTLEVKVGEGNLTYSETKNREYIKDRGSLDTVRNADDEPMEVNFDFTWEFLTAVTGSGIPTIEEVLKKTGEASAWETTSADPCEPYCVDVEVHYDPGCGGDNTEWIVFPDFRYEKLDHDLGEAQVACSGKCNAVEPTITRGNLSA